MVTTPGCEGDAGTRAIARAAGGAVEVRYGVVAGRTSAICLHEAGSLRLRHPRNAACQGVLLNVAGGIVGGDRLSYGVRLDAAAEVLVTTAAAEKVYRSLHAAQTSIVRANLTLAHEGRLLWLPQETILFDGGRLRREFAVDLATDAQLVAAELFVFGRREYGEGDIGGVLRDSWRVRRNGRLVFADETSMDGAIGRRLARGAVAGGHHAVALLLVAGPCAANALEPVRTAIDFANSEGSHQGEGGASLKDGIIVARILAPSAERLRAIVATALKAVGVSLPRVWQ